MNDRDLISGLDACRPASGDLSQPELNALAERVATDGRAAEIHVRIQRIDAAMRRAMHNVALPSGLENRLLARLHEAALGNTQRLNTPPPPTDTASAGRNTSLSRRQWLVWSTGLASAIAASVAAVMFFRPAPPLERYDLEAGRDWHNQIVAAHDWQSVKPNDLDELAQQADLQLVPQRYRDASEVVGRDAYAYDLTIPGGATATLFVIPQATRAGLPTSPPARPQSSTLGLSIAYWQRGDVIYVVVIESDRLEDYQRLVKTTPFFAA